MVRQYQKPQQTIKLITLTILVPCEDSPDHKVCGWCHEINYHGKKKRQPKDEKDKNTPLHGTHKVKMEYSIFCSPQADETAVITNLKKAIKGQLKKGGIILKCTKAVRILDGRHSMDNSSL